ncbi:MAG: CRTAC1 family protein [Acidimicrobiia bacterium]|nr:CRTAC1 family protein [Acidimicrobiia bacterium]MDX2466378.1 CRTAC1 family protein [Acidimicrobiia bacterium]
MRSWGWSKPAIATLFVLVLVAITFMYLGRSQSVTPDTAMAAPVFVEETTTGINQVYAGDFEFFVGGGVASFDCNEDGRPDLYLAGGSNPAAIYVNDSPVGGALHFSQIADPVTDMTFVLGAYPIDVDSDENLDLAVLRLGENVMLRGLGDCRFERANEAWGIDGGDQWTAAFSAKWEDGNTLPTMAFGNYLDWPVNREQTASCADNTLLRPAGDGYGLATALSPGWCTLSVLFADWDRSGGRDLRVANDRHYYVDGSEQLWRIAAGEEPRLYAESDGWNDIQLWGMGLASQDVTGDRYPEFFITSQGDNKLQTLEEGAGQPTYDDIAIRRGVTAHRPFLGEDVLPSTAWHAEFQDVNNDGFLDLFITKGNVEAMAEYAMADPNNLLLGQPDGRFEESAELAGVASLARSRGAAVADFNLDGLLDIVVVNRTENAQVWRNVGFGDADEPVDMGNWLAIQLTQPESNLQAVGAWVEVEIGDLIVRKEVTIGGGHAGDQLGWIHFGLGESDQATVSVYWPDGGSNTLSDVVANSFLIIDPWQPVEYWTPSAL